MRIEKYIYIFSAALFLAACSGSGSESEYEHPLTESQRKIQALFSGVWLDHAHSNLSTVESAYLLPEPDRLEFGQLFPEQVEIGGRAVIGEVVYVDGTHGDPVSVPCYFYVDGDGERLGLYHKGEYGFPAYKVGTIEFKGDDRFVWTTSNYILPYDFRKK